MKFYIKYIYKRNSFILNNINSNFNKNQKSFIANINNWGINKPCKNGLKNEYNYLNIQTNKEQSLKKCLVFIRENIVNLVSKIWWK